MLKRVSVFAREYEVLPSTIRHYIRIGLLSPEDYTPGKHALLGEQAEQQMEKILELKKKRYTLEEIESFLKGEPAHD